MSDFWGSLAGEASTSREVAAFASQEIIIPNGPYHDQYYSVGTQPFIRFYFDAIASRQYQRFAVVGPTQSGKTLSCSVIPTLWHLFECCDDVVYGAPTIEIAKDKWKKDFSPVIKRVRYASYMPVHGTGARGGTPTGIDFLNGASLRFMTGGGSDKTVAGYTARAITVTEVDGMDEASTKSREADRISQLEVRGDAFGLSKRVYLECTASIEEGRIWQEYLNGTHVVLVKECPYCSAWVCPEREHVRGFTDVTEREVLKTGHFVCPACEHPLTARDRVDMVHGCKEQIDNPDSLTYSFRYNAFDNLFWTPGEIALDEWRAANKPEHQKQDALKVQHQFKWAMPYKEVVTDDYVTTESLGHAVRAYRRGIIPEWAEFVTTGTDCHRFNLYWVIAAWKRDGTGQVIDYGVSDCPTADLGETRGIRNGLESMHDYFADGWQVEGASVKRNKDLGAIDAGYRQDAIVEFCKATKGYYPSLGQGDSYNSYGLNKRLYTTPTKTGGRIIEIGYQWHVTRLGTGVIVLYHNVDYEKEVIQKKLLQPPDTPGALALFDTADMKEHTTYLKHIAAEQLKEDDKGKVKWERKSRNNHYLDATCLAWTAARKLGVLAVPEVAPTQTRPKSTSAETLEQGMTRIRRRY